MKKLIYKGDQLENVYPDGTYWNILNGKRSMLPDDVVLSEGKWLRASAPMVLAAGPVVGLIFAVFLPFIGIAMSIQMLGKLVTREVWPVIVSASAFSWRPIEAYLLGRKRTKK